MMSKISKIFISSFGAGLISGITWQIGIDINSTKLLTYILEVIIHTLQSTTHDENVIKLGNYLLWEWGIILTLFSLSSIISFLSLGIWGILISIFGYILGFIFILSIFSGNIWSALITILLVSAIKLILSNIDDEIFTIYRY